MHTSFNGSAASQPDLNDPRYIPVVKSYMALLDDILAQKHAINTHMISLSTLKKWAASHINVDEINTAEGPLDELRNAIALALQELALTVWTKHNGKTDHMIYWDLARQIKGLTPETLQTINNNHGMLEAEIASKPGFRIAPYLIAAAGLLIVYVMGTSGQRERARQKQFGSPNGLVKDAPQSFTTIDGANAGKKDAQKTLRPGEDDGASLIKIINTLDKAAKFTLTPLDGTKPRIAFIEPKTEMVLHYVTPGVYTIQTIASTSMESLRNSTADRWVSVSDMKAAPDTLPVLETKKEFTRTTIWLESNANRQLVYQLHQEWEKKTKK